MEAESNRTEMKQSKQNRIENAEKVRPNFNFFQTSMIRFDKTELELRAFSILNPLDISGK